MRLSGLPRGYVELSYAHFMLCQGQLILHQGPWEGLLATKRLSMRVLKSPIGLMHLLMLLSYACFASAGPLRGTDLSQARPLRIEITSTGGVVSHIACA